MCVYKNVKNFLICEVLRNIGSKRTTKLRNRYKKNNEKRDVIGNKVGSVYTILFSRSLKKLFFLINFFFRIAEFFCKFCLYTFKFLFCQLSL